MDDVMAVDTKAKRMSADNFCNPFDYVLPIPDGSIDQADRQHLLGLYSGIEAIVLNGPFFIDRFTVFVPGDVRAHVFLPGDARSTVFLPGPTRTKVKV
jgi:hypothetical protein